MIFFGLLLLHQGPSRQTYELTIMLNVSAAIAWPNLVCRLDFAIFNYASLKNGQCNLPTHASMRSLLPEQICMF